MVLPAPLITTTPMLAFKTATVPGPDDIVFRGLRRSYRMDQPISFELINHGAANIVLVKMELAGYTPGPDEGWADASGSLHGQVNGKQVTRFIVPAGRSIRVTWRPFSDRKSIYLRPGQTCDLGFESAEFRLPDGNIQIYRYPSPSFHFERARPRKRRSG